MRRVAAGLIVTALTVCLVALDMSIATGAPAACQQYDSHGMCVVQAGTGGGATVPPSTQPVSADSDGGSEVTAPRCTAVPSGAEVPCLDGDAWWVQSMQCYVKAIAEQPPKGTAVWGGHTDGAIYSCSLRSGPNFPGTNGFAFWSATVPAAPPVIDPATLAQQALQTLTIPAPTTERYPAGVLQDGRPFTVVNAYTWFWTDSASFRVLSARAAAGGVSAEVTVTPTALSFTPGDGATAVSCAGPGVPWRPADGVWAESPAGCDYRYPHSTIHESDQEVTAVYSIRWTVSWTSSTGASGTLPELTTTSNASFAVAEVQSVVTG